MFDVENLNASNRRSKIVECVQKLGQIKLEQLHQMFNVSEVTLRRDLEILESQNMIRRIRGGAIPNSVPPLETVFQEKLRVHTEKKKQIAEKAASLVEDGRVVMLSAGTTATFLARELVKKKAITVVTSAINIAAELAGYNQITLVMIGGIVRAGSYATVGHVADDAIAHMNADFAFIGVDGVDLFAGFTTPNLMEARTDKMMLHAANQSIIVADSSKFGKVAFTAVARIDEPSLLITDNAAPIEYITQLRERGCRVLM